MTEPTASERRRPASEERSERGSEARVTHVNPPSLHASPYFSQGVIAEAGRMLYVGGQNGTDADGTISGGFAEQTTQAMRNLLAVLAAAGAGPEHVVKLTVYLTAEADIDTGFAASMAVWGNHPTAISVLRASPARPDALVEIDAVAALP